MIHGGGFMLGHARMNSELQIQDCLERGWIVVAPNHRLCPQVDLLEGPIRDCQDLLTWIRNGNLDREIQQRARSSAAGKSISVDQSNVMSMGTSAGGNLAYCLAYSNMPKPPIAVLDFYGAKHFVDTFWKQELPFLPVAPCSEEQKHAIFAERPVPTKGGVSLEGQNPADPATPADTARAAFTLNTLREGRVLETVYPRCEADPSSLELVDPSLNIRPTFPPVCIVHGDLDNLVPIHLSYAVFDKLKGAGVPCKFILVEGEGHTFAGKMRKGSKTWETQRLGFDWLEAQIKST